MKRKKSYAALKEYSLEQIETLWYGEDTNDCASREVIGVYFDQLKNLRETDEHTADARLHKIVSDTLDAIAANTITIDAAKGKTWRMFDHLVDTAQADITLHGPGMQYAIALLAMHRAMVFVEEMDDADMLGQNVLFLNGDINATLVSPQGPIFVLDLRSSETPTQQVAKNFFQPAWCALVEPDLKTMEDLVQAVWVQRPSLLHNTTTMQKDMTHIASSMPTTDCA